MNGNYRSKGLNVLVLLLLLTSCEINNSQLSNNDSDLDLIQNELQNIDVGRIQNVDMDWRSNSGLIYRKFSQNDSNGIGLPIFLNKLEEKGICFKHQNKWLELDSIEKINNISEIGVSKGDLEYCYNLMIDMELVSLNRLTRLKNSMVLIKKDYKIFYIEDSSEISKLHIEQELIKLNQNWWLLSSE